MQATEVASEERHRFVRYFEYLPRIAAVATIIIGGSVLAGYDVNLVTVDRSFA